MVSRGLAASHLQVGLMVSRAGRKGQRNSATGGIANKARRSKPDEGRAESREHPRARSTEGWSAQSRPDESRFRRGDDRHRKIAAGRSEAGTGLPQFQTNPFAANGEAAICLGTTAVYRLCLRARLAAAQPRYAFQPADERFGWSSQE